MRGIVAKRLRKEALAIVGHEISRPTFVSTIKKCLTGALDDKNRPITERVKKITMKYEGFRRVYQALKHSYTHKS